jgi:hypothetical protein
VYNKQELGGLKMKKYDHLREKAIKFRKNKGMALPEICERLSLPKTTVYYWIKDIPIDRTEKQKISQKKAKLGIVAKHRRLREEEYKKGLEEAADILKDQLLRDFVTMYLGEGDRKSRSVVGINNSTPEIMQMALSALDKITEKKRQYSLQVHEDHDVVEVLDFWSAKLKIPRKEIKTHQKTNSSKMKTRNWRSAYGCFRVTVCDTLLKQRLHGWMDYVKNSWRITRDYSREMV